MKKQALVFLLIIYIGTSSAAFAENVNIPDPIFKALNAYGISCTGEMLTADQDTLNGAPSELSVVLVNSEGTCTLVILHQNKDKKWRVDGVSASAAYQDDDTYNHIPVVVKNADVRFVIRYTCNSDKDYFQEFVFTVYQGEWMLIDAILQGEKKLVLRWWPEDKTLITLGEREMYISQRIPFSEFDILVHPDIWLNMVK